MHQAELLGQMLADRPRPIALARMVTTSQIGHAALTRQMRLGLGDFAGDVGLSARGDRRLKITLRTTSAPRYFFDS